MKLHTVSYDRMCELISVPHVLRNITIHFLVQGGVHKECILIWGSFTYLHFDNVQKYEMYF